MRTKPCWRFISISSSAPGIPEVAGEVQHAVKVAVQSMTGKPVNKVNVHVSGLVLEDDKTGE